MAASVLGELVALSNGKIMPAVAYGLGTAWYNPSKEQAEKLKESLGTALSLGYRHIDNAEMYKNEVHVGQAVRGFLKANKDVKREDLFIVSKVDNPSREPSALRKSFETSLKELGLDYLDLYLIHSPFHTQVPLGETWKEMEKLVDEGKVKSIGVSNFRVQDLEEILQDCRIRPVYNQCEIHPHLWDEGLAEYCKKNAIVLGSYGGLGPLRTFNEKSFQEFLRQTSSKYGVSAVELLQAWLLHKGVVVVTTSSKEDHMKKSLDTINIQLKPEDVDEITSRGSKAVHRRFWDKEFKSQDDESRARIS